ncbi:MAG: lipopolysaccharide heptosyltransferase family protein [Gemmatimonadetes bacterium]|nr:MAG: lipopolysaccharide heptosyltransferase family protein [Gemmatimonadota bacterium]
MAATLRRARPEAEVVWVAQPAPAQVVTPHPAVDRVVAWHPTEGASGVVRLWRALAALRCDVVFDLQRYLKAAWPTLGLRAPVRVGLDPSKTRDGLRWLHNAAPPRGPWKHTQDLFLDALAVAGVPRPDPLRWPLELTDDERTAGRALRDRVEGRPLCAVAVASGNARKDWPAERYVPVVEALERDFGFAVALVGGPARHERRAAAAIARAARTRPLDLLGDSVRALIAHVAAAALVVSPDTGTLHLAHALRVPVVGLFGHTNPWRVGPYERFHDLVVDAYTDPAEHPDPSRYEPRHGRMERIRPEDVLARVELALERYGAAGPEGASGPGHAGDEPRPNRGDGAARERADPRGAE